MPNVLLLLVLVVALLCLAGVIVLVWDVYGLAQRAERIETAVNGITRELEAQAAWRRAIRERIGPGGGRELLRERLKQRAAGGH